MSDLRWDPYVLVQNERFSRFWSTHLAMRERKVAIIAGLGFDARACLASERILAGGGAGTRDLFLICYEHGQTDADVLRPLVEANDKAFTAAFDGRGKIERVALNMRGEHGRFNSGPATQRVLRDKVDVLGYDDVVIDISALPRMIALTVISFYLNKFDAERAAGRPVPNLHVGVAESVALDVQSTGESLQEEVVFVPGFTGRANAETTNNPKIWLPVLGEGQDLRLQRIVEKLAPDEICPVIPFPSRNARRGDALIEEYRQFLFAEHGIDPRNIVRASEFNPFEAYRQIIMTVTRYRDALGELGSCRAIISPLSSKLLSVGALLAAYELKSKRPTGFQVGMYYVEAGSYQPPRTAETECDLSGLWILGEWER